MRADDSTLGRLRTWLSETQLPDNGRLPPERELAARFGIKRAELRKALAVMEGEGHLRRHVGKGTFLAKEGIAGIPSAAEIIANRTSPPEAMQARIVVEPEIARLAALKATSAQIAEMKELCRQMRQAKTWNEYEQLDWRFHNLLAEASGNNLLLEIQRLVNGVRRAVVWGRLARRPVGPSADYHSFAEHEAIVDAISNRDRRGAAEAMRCHLNSTASTMLDE
ncbi:MAG TPA: FCD domain-containing protein [Microvirga sp.]|nr:FCD domain-containing protein [Microvirga sp.]